MQTFVLAQQPSGYFVLNDILRYIDEEADEEPTEALRDADATAEELPVADTTEAKEEPVATATEPVEEADTPVLDAGVVDQKLEEATKEASEPDEAPIAQESAETSTAPAETAAKPEGDKNPDPDATAREVAEETAKEIEKPADPSPTPVKTRQPPPPTSVPAQPPKPMTWASRAAAAASAGPRPVVPLPKTTTSPVTQPRTAAPIQPAATQPAAAQPAASTTQNTESAAPAATAKETPTEWQTAGSDSKRQNRPQSISGPQTEKDGTMGYVKYVTEKVKHEDLKAALAQHGDLVYFDINRQKVSYSLIP